jgi:type IV secretion system protein TrbJ
MIRPLSPIRSALLATAIAVLVISVGDMVVPAGAQMIVFDPNNYAQNLLTAARALQQINNQITSLQNQARMLTNQARNLAHLPTSTLQQLQSNLQRTQTLLAQAQNITFDVNRIQHAFSATYGTPPAYSSNAALLTAAQTRGQISLGAFQDSLKIQAGVVGNIGANNTTMSSLVTSSQSASGALQASQAGNQLLALHSQQLSDLIAVLSAKARADALEQARSVTTEAQGQAQYQLFSMRSGYLPSTVQMFSGH